MITDPTASARHTASTSTQSTTRRNSAPLSASADIAQADRYESTSAGSPRAASPARLDSCAASPAKLSIAAPKDPGVKAPTTIAPQAPSVESVEAALHDAALDATVKPYKTHLQRAEGVWSAHEVMLKDDDLGGLSVKAGALAETADEVPPFELTCGRLTCGREVTASFGDVLRSLAHPQTRSEFVEKNGEESLQDVRKLAATQIIRATAEHHKLVNNIAMANCNESLREFVMARPNLSTAAGWHAQRAWSHHEAVVQACAPVTEQVTTVAKRTYDRQSDVTHAVWMPWLKESRQQLNDSLADAAPMLKEIVGDSMVDFLLDQSY